MKSLSLIITLCLQIVFLKPIFLGTPLAQYPVDKFSTVPVSFNSQVQNPQSSENQVHHLSITASSFTPTRGYYNYENHGRYLKYYDNPSDSEPAVFLAPIQLPQGAVITKMTFYFKDPGAGTAYARLTRATHYQIGSIFLASLSSTDLFPPSLGDSSTSTFSLVPVIDNSLHYFFIQIELPPGGLVWAYGVELEYTLPLQPVSPGKITIPPAAFSPYEDGYDFLIGERMWHYWGPEASQTNGWYLAPLYLPDGAVVKKMTFYWHRIDASVVATVHLQRTRLGYDTYQDLAVANSLAGVGDFYSSTTDSTINPPLIDNSQYAYWLIVDLPAVTNPANGVVELQDVEIEYELPQATGYLDSVPAAGFRGFEDGYDYQNHGRHLFHAQSPGGGTANGWYLNALNLPDGHNISTLSFYAYVNSTQPGALKLQRTEWGTGNYEDLAVIVTGTGNLGNSKFTTNTIMAGPIDNSRYGYWLFWDLPSNSIPGVEINGQAVQISSGFGINLPLIIH